MRSSDEDNIENNDQEVHKCEKLKSPNKEAIEKDTGSNGSVEENSTTGDKANVDKNSNSLNKDDSDKDKENKNKNKEKVNQNSLRISSNRNTQIYILPWTVSVMLII